MNDRNLDLKTIYPNATQERLTVKHNYPLAGIIAPNMVIRLNQASHLVRTLREDTLLPFYA
jgi:hypothetical protein